MTFHDLIGKLLTVDGVVDGAPDGNIGSDIVPNRIAIGVFFTCRNHREHNAAVFHAVAYPKFQIFLLRSDCHRWRDTYESQLAAARCGISVIFIKEDKHQLTEIIFLTGIPRVSLNDQLLPRLKTHQSIRTRANRIFSECFFVIPFLRNNS